VMLAEIVGELVPQLPPDERSRFARKLFAKAQDASPQHQSSDEIATTMLQESDANVPRRQFLKDAETLARTGVALVAHAGASRAALPSQCLPRVGTSHRIGAAQNRLWGRLSSASPPSEVNFALRAKPTKLQENLDGRQVEPDRQLPLAAACAIDIPAVSAREADIGKDVRVHEDIPVAVDTPPSAHPPIDELRDRLESALRRVEALEAKLEKQSSGLRGEVEDLRSRTVATEVKVDSMPKFAASASEAAAIPPLPSWPPSFLPDVFGSDALHQGGSYSNGSGSTKSTVHIRKPFNFEEYRKSQSQSLQNERLRVLVPPDPWRPFPGK